MAAKQNWVAFHTILLKEIKRFARIWIQTVLPPMITTSLYFVIFGNLIGRQLQDIHGYQYVDYIVPGLILMSVISNSYANVVSSFYSAKFQKNIEEMIVSPTPNYIILLGYVGGGVARGLCVGVAVSIVALFFSNVNVNNVLILFSTAFLTAILFSLGGLLNAIFAKSFDDISIIPTFILQPLTYLGGIFYSIDLLPEIWHSISLFNPILYMINGFRYGMLGVSDINIVLSYVIITAFIVVLFLICLFFLERGWGIKR